jgi:hypothetical protein
VSILSQNYRSLKLDNLCRACHGSPMVFLKKPRCPLCKRNHAAWVKAGYETECKEIIYLYETWQKVKKFKSQSTGIPATDACIVFLFGIPCSEFGASNPAPMPQKVACYSPELNYPPIHLNT